MAHNYSKLWECLGSIVPSLTLAYSVFQSDTVWLEGLHSFVGPMWVNIFIPVSVSFPQEPLEM